LGQTETATSTGPWTAGERGALAAVQRAGTAAVFTGPVIADIVDDIEGIRALTRDYERLYQVTANTLPFARQEWHLAWCEHLLNHSPRARQEPLFCVLRNAQGACVAIVPLILTRRQLGPLRVAALGLMGADPALTEIRNPLIEPGYERATVRALHERLASVPGWDWIQWSGVSAPLAQALALEAAPQWYQTLDDYVLDLPAAWAEFRATLRRNLRESLRHCYNSLRRDGHTFEFVVARDPVEVRWALYRFLQLHAQRAHMQWGPVHADFWPHIAPGRFSTRSVSDWPYATRSECSSSASVTQW
jgi:hypothetical protein